MKQQCNASRQPSVDWPLGRPSCCSSLDRDSLSTLCFAALEKIKLSTATLALMSPLSAKWITVNNAKCYTNNDLLIPKHLYILQEILHTLCCMFHCNYVSVFMEIIVSLLTLLDYTQKLHMETCAFKWWNSVCKCFPVVYILKSAAFTVGNIHNQSVMGYLFFYPGTSYFMAIVKVVDFSCTTKYRSEENLPNFASAVSFAILSYCKKRGEGFCTCKSNCIQ